MLIKVQCNITITLAVCSEVLV